MIGGGRELIRMRQLLLLIVLMPLFAADPPGFVVWKASDLKSYNEKLAAKTDDHKVAFESLAKYGDYQTLLVHREGDGEAEIHEKHAELLIVEAGEATLVVGGDIASPRTTAPGEIRASSILGGERTKLGAGDVVRIPANLPHQLLVAAGKPFTYLVVQQPADGETVERKIEEAPTAVATPSAPAAPAVGWTGDKPVLGVDLGNGFRACVHGDSSPAGTVVDGYKKETSQGLIGVSCVWEKEIPATEGVPAPIGNGERPKLGADTGGGYRACLPGENSPAGTVVDGHKKVVAVTPFGTSCAWEKIE
jgi:mannose-6-phosphate isomerase-like protein (cupin superfamily)